jgi:hypothetical protein
MEALVCSSSHYFSCALSVNAHFCESGMTVGSFTLQCINHYGSDISKCQFYLDMLNECRRGGAGVGASL